MRNPAVARWAAATAFMISPLVGVSASRAATYTITQCNYGGAGQRPMLAWSPTAPPFTGYVDACQQSAGGVYAFVQEAGRMNPNETRGASFASPSSAITIDRVRVQYRSFPVSGGSRAFLQFFSFGAAGQQVLQQTDIGDATSGTSADFGLPSASAGFGMFVYCSTSASTSCYWGDPFRIVHLTGIQEVLREQVPPSVAIVGGTLVSGGSRSGDQTLAYTAVDGESGVAGVKVTLGGTAVGGEDFSHDPARCPYVSWAACSGHASNDSLVVHTHQVEDGTYSVQLTAYDAAGNQVSAQRDSVTVSNAPHFEIAPRVSGEPQVGHAAAVASDGRASGLSRDGSPARIGRVWSRCSAEGNACRPIEGAGGNAYQPTADDVGRTLRVADVAVNDHGTATSVSEPSRLVRDQYGNAGLNGRNATPAARIVLLRPRARALRLTPFARSGRMLRGRITGDGQVPIAGALLEVFQQPELDAGQLQPIASTRSADDGSWSVRLPRGPSRLVRIAYRYTTNDSELAAHVDFEQRVGAGVALSATPHLRNGQAIRFRGRLLGGFVPAAGKQVELQVRVGRRWQDFRRSAAGPMGALSRPEG